MKILVKNVEYYEWEVPEEVLGTYGDDYQIMIDQYFNPTDIAVVEESDPYYEFVEVKEQ